MNLVRLASSPVRVSAPAKQDLRLVLDVSEYSEVELELDLQDDSRTTPEISLLTGMRCDSEDGWVTVDSFVPTNAPSTLKKTLFPLLRYLRWEVTAGTPTFVLTGVGHKARAFRPPDIKSCMLWLRSDLSVTVTGGNVSAWSDRSGSGNDASQSSASVRPAYTAAGWSNGLPTLDFVASSLDYLSLPSGMSSSSNDYTLLVAIDQRSATTNPQDLLSTDTVTPARIFTPVSYLTNQPGIYDGSWRSCGSAATTGEQVLTWVLDSGASSFTCYRDGSSLGSGSYTGGWSWTTPRIGKLSTSQAFDGELAEMILYDRVLEEHELARVHRYLLARYGV